MNEYMQEVLATVKKRNPGDPEFIQTVEEVFKSLEVVIERHPEYKDAALLERIVEPDRMIYFRVTWVDDQGKPHVNRGYRCQFNSAIGPYKGGLRFHPSVYSGIMKFLAFEQIFKNSLTGLPIGGGKGGSDFDPRGRSDAEIMRFCQAFMTELYKYIGPNTDVPAGDLGVGGKEIGFLFGQYKRIKTTFEGGVLTGKGTSYGGSLIRPEATGYGAIYYICEVFKHLGDSIEGKTFAVSGFGNVAWGAVKKIAQKGGKAVTVSGPDGFIYDPEGIVTKEKIDYLLELRASGNDRVQDYAKKFGCEFYPGKKPWGNVSVDVCMPCATQNEVGLEEAKRIVESGTKYYIEVSNMPTTNEALDYLMSQEGLTVAPSKAVNSGGVATSALEMSQNSQHYMWSAEEVDARLQEIMCHVHKVSMESAEEYGLGYNLVAGANIAAFKKVAEAMMDEGYI